MEQQRVVIFRFDLVEVEHVEDVGEDSSAARWWDRVEGGVQAL